ncbi:GAF and ANTAR domain-containing protein [Amycolatopsis sp.]|uniref:GAF and ANTAR domain-containing protein n=1 Tax=Amycolatopsis sp. TaxID=37632 RepID=UPI002C5CAD93|nr:GAF and ANTAR domain-containing protein [Amycolatopsis sp.]HVV14568.1 GAF and ANTAR domain-containing protein [Amycolatopsis sp.]
MTKSGEERIAVRQALVVRLTGDAVSATLREAAGTGPSPSLVVLDLRELEPLATEDALLVREFARTRSAEGIRCHLVANGAPARALALPLFADVDHALAGESGTDGAPSQVEQFESLTRTLLGAPSVAAALERIVNAATVVVPGADLVSITLRTGAGEFRTPVETDELAAELDQVQYRSGRGPCLDAARPEGPGYVVSDDLGIEQRWPELASAAYSHGYGSIIATELVQAKGTEQPSGALNIYSHKTRGLTDTDRHAALLLATHASLALAHANTTEFAELKQAQLRQAIDSRDIIGQAKGILMNRQGISADVAFDLLRRTSQDLNVKLVELARTLTTRHGDLDRD